jgi:hypothetical protein
MSWLYSLALVEAFSAATCSDGARSALSSGTPTPRAFCALDRMTAFSRPSRFGMTFGPLTDALGAELLMWFLADSRARTSAAPASEKASTENDRDCGLSLLGSFARLNPDTSSWRTPQTSFLEDSELFSETWPAWGVMRDGVCWEQPTSAPPISESESGLLPTLLASNTKAVHLRSNGRPPRSYLPTITVNGNYNRVGAGPKSGDGLATVVGGPLNPTWAEWFMGWPLGWTELDALATDKYLKAWPSPGDCSEAA